MPLPLQRPFSPAKLSTPPSRKRWPSSKKGLGVGVSVDPEDVAVFAGADGQPVTEGAQVGEASGRAGPGAGARKRRQQRADQRSDNPDSGEQLGPREGGLRSMPGKSHVHPLPLERRGLARSVRWPHAVVSH